MPRIRAQSRDDTAYWSVARNRQLCGLTVIEAPTVVFPRFEVKHH